MKGLNDNLPSELKMTRVLLQYNLFDDGLLETGLLLEVPSQEHDVWLLLWTDYCVPVVYGGHESFPPSLCIDCDRYHCHYNALKWFVCRTT